jgi:Na+/alanine symporter
MAVPNLIGLVLLGGVVRQVTKEYLQRWDAGKITSPFGD